MNESRALTCRADFCEYLRISVYKFYRLLNAGLPAEKRGGSWVGNKDEVNEWFKTRRKKRARDS